MTDMRADYENLEGLLHRTADSATGFHRDLDDRPVQAPDRDHATDRPLPESGTGAAAAIAELERDVFPKLSGSVGPRFFGFVTGGATPAAIAGDWLCSALDQNAADPGDSAASAVAYQALTWLKDLFHLPRDRFEGAFVSGATMANVMGVYAGIQHLGRRIGVDPARAGLRALPPIRLYGGSPHSSMDNAVAALGLGRDSIRRVGTRAGSEAIDPAALEAALEAAPSDELKIVTASVGTVIGTDFDDMHRLADLAEAHGAWLHADGAFGLFARCVGDLAPLAEGVERADSIASDGHKWLNVPYDCGFYFVRNIREVEASWGPPPAYLDVPGAVPPFMGRTVENSQRLRGLAVWATLRAYGAEGARQIVRDNCRQATKLAAWIESTPGFELLHPVKLNVVCFRAEPSDGTDGKAFNEAVRAAANATGRIYLTPGFIHGTAGIRAAFSNWMTRDGDVDILCAALADGLAAVKENAA